jgi:hypothetical protein
MLTIFLSMLALYLKYQKAEMSEAQRTLKYLKCVKQVSLMSLQINQKIHTTNKKITLLKSGEILSHVMGIPVTTWSLKATLKFLRTYQQTQYFLYLKNINFLLFKDCKLQTFGRLTPFRSSALGVLKRSQMETVLIEKNSWTRLYRYKDHLIKEVIKNKGLETQLIKIY